MDFSIGDPPSELVRGQSKSVSPDSSTPQKDGTDVQPTPFLVIDRFMFQELGGGVGLQLWVYAGE